jgi:hypothetical protein
VVKEESQAGSPLEGAPHFPMTTSSFQRDCNYPGGVYRALSLFRRHRMLIQCGEAEYQQRK